MIQMWNTKFEDSAVICIWVMLITDLNMHQPQKKCDFRLQETSKHVNPAKSQFQKFDSKTALSLSDMAKKDLKKILNCLFKKWLCVVISQHLINIACMK